MKISIGLRLAAVVSLLVGATAYGQAVRSVSITPEKATLLIGESRSFRLVDQNGRIQQDASWSVSDSSALETRSGAELTVTAKAVGDFTVSAQSAGGSAEASLKVVEGTSLPNGTAKWSGVSFEGCVITIFGLRGARNLLRSLKFTQRNCGATCATRMGTSLRLDRRP